VCLCVYVSVSGCMYRERETEIGDKETETKRICMLAWAEFKDSFIIDILF